MISIERVAKIVAHYADQLAALTGALMQLSRVR